MTTDDIMALADWLDDLFDADGEPKKAAAELRRLHQHELALKEWLDKTEWVQETHEAYELGMHRADALKRRIDRLVDTLAETHTTYQAKLLQDEALLRQALEALEWIVTGRGHDTVETTHAAIRTRLGEAT